MDPITSVMRIMTDSVSNVKLATLAMSAFRQSRLKSDGESMESAIARAADALPSAIQSAQASETALVRAQAEVQAQESLRWQQLQREAEIQARALERERRRRALEVASMEAQTEAQEAGETGEGGGGQDSGGHPADRDAGGGPAPVPDEAPELVEGAAEKGVLYTHKGTVKGKLPRKNVTFTA